MTFSFSNPPAFGASEAQHELEKHPNYPTFAINLTFYRLGVETALDKPSPASSTFTDLLIAGAETIRALYFTEAMKILLEVFEKQRPDDVADALIAIETFRQVNLKKLYKHSGEYDKLVALFSPLKSEPK